MQHSSLDLELQNLSKSKLIDYLPHLEGIDADTLGEPWGQAQWLMDLPGKWELSQVLLRNERPIGFLIASRKEATVHFHRIAVAANERRKGFGNLLMAAVARGALDQGYTTITAKVHHTNAASIAMCTGVGFTVMGRQRENLEMRADSQRICDLAQSV